MQIRQVHHCKMSPPMDLMLSGALCTSPKSLIYNLSAAQRRADTAPEAMRCNQCAPVVFIHFFMCPLEDLPMQPFQALQVEPKGGMKGHRCQDMIFKRIRWLLDVWECSVHFSFLLTNFAFLSRHDVKW